MLKAVSIATSLKELSYLKNFREERECRVHLTECPPITNKKTEDPGS